MGRARRQAVDAVSVSGMGGSGPGFSHPARPGPGFALKGHSNPADIGSCQIVSRRQEPGLAYPDRRGNARPADNAA